VKFIFRHKLNRNAFRSDLKFTTLLKLKVHFLLTFTWNFILCGKLRVSKLFLKVKCSIQTLDLAYRDLLICLKWSALLAQILLGITFLRNTTEYIWKTELWIQQYDKELNAFIPLSDYADYSKIGASLIKTSLSMFENYKKIRATSLRLLFIMYIILVSSNHVLQPRNSQCRLKGESFTLVKTRHKDNWELKLRII
jgi:hypothetical protein